MTAAALAPEWVPVCDYADLTPERGVAALIDGAQIALFRLADGSLRAVGNRDPFSGAYVLAAHRRLARPVAHYRVADAQARVRPGLGRSSTTRHLPADLPVRVADGRVQVGCPRG